MEILGNLFIHKTRRNGSATARIRNEGKLSSRLGMGRKRYGRDKFAFVKCGPAFLYPLAQFLLLFMTPEYRY